MQQCVGYVFTRLPPIIKGVRFHLAYDFLKKLLENLNIITQMGRGKDLTEGERYTVKMLKKENKSAAEIGRILGRSPTSIKSCLKRLELTTDTAYLKRPNCGRKRIIDERTERRVLREIKTNPSLKKLPKRDLAKEISSGMPKTFSSATLVRTLKENGFKSRVARKKPFISEENRHKRLKWARDHKNFKREDWRRVLWTDESSVSTDSYGKVRVWCRKDELYDPECTQATVKSGRKSIMVWGCVNGQGTNHLLRCSSHMNGQEYGNLVLDVIYPMIVTSENAIFQEDNAPIHKCKIVSQLKQELGIEAMEWPPQSPDLSPIENVWREVKRWIHQNRKPRTEKELLEAVEDAWEAIAPEVIMKFVDSMPERISDVIKRKGYATKW
jgi:Transposase/DDE superfamily endonuclease/Helix-turn-helix domain